MLLPEIVRRITAPTPTTVEAEPIREASNMAIAELVHAFTVGNETIRDAIICATNPYLLQLHEFADSMSIRSVRRSDTNLIQDGMVALVIDDLRFDERDTIVILSLLCNSARKLGLDDVELVIGMAQLARRKCANLFVDFVQRDDIHRSIGIMGFEESANDKGFTYVPTKLF